MADTLNILSLASGTAMLDIAIERTLGVPCRTISVEIEAFAAANLVAKTEEGRLAVAAVWPNLKTFAYGEFHGCIDVLTAGFPCQPFSNAGKRDGVNDERHLYPYIADGISAVEPTIVVLENVPGIITAKCADGTPVLLYVLRDLEQRGYAVTWGIYSAEEVGATQRRERVFILAVENSELNRWRGWGDGIPQGQGCPLQTEGPGELAFSASLRQQQRSQTNAKHRKPGKLDRTSFQWPAEREQRQFDWEEPRTIEPRLGRTANGMACRVDRLRLTGNGVVWQTAEKAFRELIVELIFEH